MRGPLIGSFFFDVICDLGKVQDGNKTDVEGYCTARMYS